AQASDERAKKESDKVVVTMDDAMKNFNSGDYKAAADQFDKILHREPDNAEALYFGGISEYINGKTDKSEKNFDKLLKAGSSYQDGSKWYKANILLKKGKRDDAKKILEQLSSTNGSYKERAIKKMAELGF
ncbi:MAG TPA: tetratricopeptide repeat protein, partial [Chitinophagales bacterium]|nr:tetratricopeptide repeat protein [Chitinophagales bacterium]